MGTDTLEQREQVVDVWNEVAEHDVIERLPCEVELLAGAHSHVEFRVSTVRELDHTCAHVDTDATVRFERC